MRVTKNLLTAALMTVVTTVIFGLVYPLAVTELAQVIFHDKANGAVDYARDDGTVVGSPLIGQPFSSPGYFRSRPSAAGPAGYDAGASARLQPRPDEPEADRAREGRCGEATRRESRLRLSLLTL